MTGQQAANWYPDPAGRYDFRYWDGSRWTQHVMSDGRPAIDPAGESPPAATPTGRKSKKIQRAVQRSGAAAVAAPASGSLFTEPVLVVSQKAKLIEVNAEYAVYNQHGQHIASVREIGQSFMKKAVTPLPDARRTHRLQIVDPSGQVLMVLTRPGKIVRYKMVVRDPSGAEIGQIVQKDFGIVGKTRLALESDGRSLASINAESWDAWDFNIEDKAGNEIARITKSWAGLMKETFTKGDNYVVQIHRQLDEPLRSLVISAALAIDTSFRQGSN